MNGGSRCKTYAAGSADLELLLGAIVVLLDEAGEGHLVVALATALGDDDGGGGSGSSGRSWGGSHDGDGEES